MRLVLLADSDPGADGQCWHLGSGALSRDIVRQTWGDTLTAAVAELLGPSPGARGLWSMLPWPAVDELLMMMSVARVRRQLPQDEVRVVDCGDDPVRILGIPATAAAILATLTAPAWATARGGRVPADPDDAGSMTPLQRLRHAVEETVELLHGTDVVLGPRPRATRWVGEGQAPAFASPGTDPSAALDSRWQDVVELSLLGYRVVGTPACADAGAITWSNDGCTWTLPITGALDRDLAFGEVRGDQDEVALVLRAPSWQRVVMLPPGLRRLRLRDVDIEAACIRVHFGTATNTATDTESPSASSAVRSSTVRPSAVSIAPVGDMRASGDVRTSEDIRALHGMVTELASAVEHGMLMARPMAAVLGAGLADSARGAGPTDRPRGAPGVRWVNVGQGSSDHGAIRVVVGSPVRKPGDEHDEAGDPGDDPDRGEDGRQ